MGMTISFTAVTPDELASASGDVDRCEELLDRPRSEGVYLDKAWSGIEYLLGRAGYGFEFTMDGDLLDDGGAWFGWSDKSPVDLHVRLSALPFDALAKHYDGDAMTEAEVYPEIWAFEPDEGLGYLESHYAGLRAFVADAAASGSAAIMLFSY